MLYLRLLKALGIGREGKLVRVERTEEVVDLLERNQSRIVLPRHLYWRCYPLLGARSSDRRVVIV